MRAERVFDKEKSLDDILTIELFGEKFRFKPDERVEDSQQIADHLTGYVEKAEEHFEQAATGKNKLAVLLLAAMNMSKDFHELKLEHSRLEELVIQRTTSLIKKIDDGIR